MSGKRVSHSLLDPWVIPLVPKLYRLLAIPKRFPPEGIVAVGHLIAIAGAFGLAWSTTYAWAAVVGAAGVGGNHLADMVDGTHARSTGQCRNGGELLDHFTDPLSFCYWMIGIAVSCGRLDMGIAAVVIIYATALLTSIKAKMVGEFTLARFGPTEFKALLCVYALVMAVFVAVDHSAHSVQVARWWLAVLIVIGVVQLVVNIVGAVREVNVHGSAPDTTDWELAGGDGKTQRGSESP